VQCIYKTFEELAYRGYTELYNNWVRTINVTGKGETFDALFYFKSKEDFEEGNPKKGIIVCLHIGHWHELRRDQKSVWVGQEQPDIHKYNQLAFIPERLDILPEYQEDNPQRTSMPEETQSKHSLHSDKSIVSKQQVNLNIRHTPLPIELSPTMASTQTTTQTQTAMPADNRNAQASSSSTGGCRGPPTAEEQIHNALNIAL
jgi:hypothetical protein